MELLLWPIKSNDCAHLNVLTLEQWQRATDTITGLSFPSTQVLELVWRPAISSVCDRTTVSLSVFGRGSVWCRETQAACWTTLPDRWESWNKLKLSCFNELQISDSSKDFGPVHQYSRRRCAVILLQKNRGPSLGTNGTRDFRKHFCFFSVKLYRLQ